MKKQSNLSRLINYAGSYRVLVYLSWILSGVSAVLALLPFYFLWKIIQEILNVMPDFAQATELTYNFRQIDFAMLTPQHYYHPFQH